MLAILMGTGLSFLTRFIDESFVSYHLISMAHTS